jgi:hypothetical protein
MDYLATAALFLTAVGLLIAYFAMPKENRQDLQTFLQRVFGVARTTAGRFFKFVGALLPFLVVASSLYGLWLFYSSQEPIRRSEVIMVGMHMINVLFYTFLSAQVVSLWREGRKPVPADGEAGATIEEAQQ